MQYKNRKLWGQVLSPAFIGLTLLTISLPTSAALPHQRTDLKVLLLSADGMEPTTMAWEESLKQEGVPYEKWVLATNREPLAAANFAETLPDGTPHAKYQAVIVATSGLVYENGQGGYSSALSPDEWTTLKNFEATYGIRQVTALVYPTPEYGLQYPTASRDLAGSTATLTTAGRTVFPYLQGPVPIDVGSWGYLAKPVDATKFQTLVQGPTTSSLVGVLTHPDMREEMVLTVGQNPYQSHSRLLRHGMLKWVTQGVFLGYRRNYWSMHVDDVFMPNDRWDPITKTSIDSNLIRMTPTHVNRAIYWQVNRGMRLDFAFNAAGSVDAGAGDRLSLSLLNNKNSFRWISHTYSHLIFDDMDEDPLNGAQVADLPTIRSELKKNIDFAVSKGIPLNQDEIVTGGHSGLSLPDMATAFTELGIKWVGDDNSRRPNQYFIGSGLTVPRHPTNIYYNTSTMAEQLDEYNYLYLPPSLGGSCVDTATTTCFTAPASWETYVQRESDGMLSHILNNDPRPHYVHQSNLTGDGILYVVGNRMLFQYRKFMKPAIENGSFTEMAEALTRASAWTSAREAGLVQAYLQDDLITLQSISPEPVAVPISGATLGADYGGTRSGWQTLPAYGTATLTRLP
jgi:hypothetical protein